MKFTVNVVGDIQRSLMEFSRQIQEEAVRPAAHAMALVVYEEARRLAPVDSGALRDAIYRAFAPEISGDGLAVYRISWNKAKAWYGQLVEFGYWYTTGTRAGKDLQRVKWIPPRSFVRQAWANVSGDAARAGHERLGERIREIRAGGRLMIERTITLALSPLVSNQVFTDEATDAGVPYIVFSLFGGRPTTYLAGAADKARGLWQFNVWGRSRSEASQLCRAAARVLIEHPDILAVPAGVERYRREPSLELFGSEQDFHIWFSL